MGEHILTVQSSKLKAGTWLFHGQDIYKNNACFVGLSFKHHHSNDYAAS